MNPRIQRFGAFLAACGVLGACGDDRLSSTEVENEVSVLVASSEDTAPLRRRAAGFFSDSTTTIASGTTDSTGAFATDLQRTEAPYLFLRIETRHGNIADDHRSPRRERIGHHTHERQPAHPTPSHGPGPTHPTIGTSNPSAIR